VIPELGSQRFPEAHAILRLSDIPMRSLGEEEVVIAVRIELGRVERIVLNGNMEVNGTTVGSMHGSNANSA
jgi:hypothetical protein